MMQDTRSVDPHRSSDHQTLNFQGSGATRSTSRNKMTRAVLLPGPDAPLPDPLGLWLPGPPPKSAMPQTRGPSPGLPPLPFAPGPPQTPMLNRVQPFVPPPVPTPTARGPGASVAASHGAVSVPTRTAASACGSPSRGLDSAGRARCDNGVAGPSRDADVASRGRRGPHVAGLRAVVAGGCSGRQQLGRGVPPASAGRRGGPLRGFSVSPAGSDGSSGSSVESEVGPQVIRRPTDRPTFSQRNLDTP